MAVARERRAQLGVQLEPAPKFATGRAASTHQDGAGGYGDVGAEGRNALGRRQGSSNNSSAHPNQGKDGCSFVNFTPDPDKAGPGSAKGKGKHAATAATSSSSSTVADADLQRAKSHIAHLQNQIRQTQTQRDVEHLKYAKAIELASTLLSLQAKATNELISAHARALRTSQLETFTAIAKIREIRGHAESFAETMLAKATQDARRAARHGRGVGGLQRPAIPEVLAHAQWGDDKKKKLPGSRSKVAFNITAFQVAESAAPPTPIQHTVHQLTDAKVIVQPTPDGYEAPFNHADSLVPWATAARGKKRKRMRDDGDDDSDAASSVAHDEVEDDDDDGSP